MGIKKINWWKRFSFWTKVKLALIPLAFGGEVAVYTAEKWATTEAASGFWYLVPPLASYAIYLLTNLVKDDNKDGVVDGLEDNKK
jgi:hypothetical protein